jgi:molecular chaperone DnaJ
LERKTAKMGNPYEILGIKEGASEAEIKAAYKAMVKKYHPDRYQDNPLSDLAEEKLREVNEAYDYLMKFGSAGGSSTGGYQQSSAAPEFQQIRRDLDAGRLRQAEAALNRMQVKNAEWVFLNGMLAYKKGWYDEAASNIQQAVNMEPNNMEYRRTLNTLMNQGSGYRNAAAGRGYQSNNDVFCQALQCYCCLDLCCDCI